MKAEMIEIAFIDLDGTLLDRDLSISQKNLDALLFLRDSGVILAVATGRSKVGLPDSVKQIIDLFSFLILSNGTKVFDQRIGKYLFQKYISLRKAQAIVHQILAESIFDVSIDCLIDGKWHTDKSSITFLETKDVVDKSIFSYLSSTRIIHDDIYLFLKHSQNDVEKIVVSFETENRPYFERIVFNIANTVGGIITDSDKPHKLDLFSDDARKGFACEYLMNYLHISREHAVSFGNDNNDLEMFSKTGFSIAMLDSVAELKNMANYIAQNPLNGVAEGVDILRKTMII